MALGTWKVDPVENQILQKNFEVTKPDATMAHIDANEEIRKKGRQKGDYCQHDPSSDESEISRSPSPKAKPVAVRRVINANPTEEQSRQHQREE